MSWMSIVDLKKTWKRPEKRKKQHPTENQKNAKYQNVSWRGPSFYIWLARRGARPLHPRWLHHWPPAINLDFAAKNNFVQWPPNHICDVYTSQKPESFTNTFALVTSHHVHVGRLIFFLQVCVNVIHTSQIIFVRSTFSLEHVQLRWKLYYVITVVAKT